ncbi:deoxyribodipyrimidine photo-lyase [Mycobacterium sp. 141]|uniref:cryptochrome/photolyase family protein n=1 Tax=Mycobacterium sp. 141 TaxID=1120797 RepID=UPI0004767658|nr:deoxyribodipyrimidine photo-lyase [Mycobacterium sp. 141]
MPTLLWFRRDLRLADHPALLAAAQDDAEVLACYVLDPRLTASAGHRRLRYLYRSLHELRARLDGRLLVVQGRPEQQIPRLARGVGADSVHVSQDYSPFGRRRDDAVRTALADVSLCATGSPYLVSPGRISKQDGAPYQVFTPYYRAWRDHGWRAPAASGPDSARWIDPAGLPGATEIPDIPGRLDAPAGELAATTQWRKFVETSLPGYATDRDRPDLDTTSRMSAHLKFGTIHPRTMAVDLGADADAYLRELAFRDFYATVLHHWPESAWQSWNRGLASIEVDDGPDAQRMFDAWTAGMTGFPIVDAGMRQLARTGFMHNRVRMIAASFLVKDLHLPWQWGARWFLDQLTDGDVANNQHGWQWVAGCGTDAAPYFRVFNPTVQGAKFDPAGEYIRRWVPELAEVADVHKLGEARPEQYPAPIVDHAEERREALRRYQQLR